VAIAYRAFGTVKKGTTGNLASIVLPTGHTTNDILILKLIAADNATGTMSAGWVQKLGVNNGVSCRYEEWWKRDNGSEVAPTVTRTGTKVASLCWIEAYSGVDSGLSDPYRDAQTQTGTGTATGNFTITCPALTGVVSGDFRLAFVGFGAAVTDGTPSSGRSAGGPRTSPIRCRAAALTRRPARRTTSPRQGRRAASRRPRPGMARTSRAGSARRAP
jgi:hypothetical protein